MRYPVRYPAWEEGVRSPMVYFWLIFAVLTLIVVAGGVVRDSFRRPSASKHFDQRRLP